MRKTILFLLLLLFCKEAKATSYMLNVPEVTQEHNLWCWDATTYTVLKYYGIDKYYDSDVFHDVEVSQCQIAEVARKKNYHHTSTDFGTVHCCEACSTIFTTSQASDTCSCNQANSVSSIAKLLEHFGVPADSMASSLSRDSIISYLSSHRPVIYRWGWTKLDGNNPEPKETGGHFLVIFGFDTASDMVSYMDPWYGEGYSVGEYSRMLELAPETNKKGHKWTHTIWPKASPAACANNNNTFCCSCSNSQDLCCDGCRPFADGTACGGEGSNNCLSPGTCQNGQCSGRTSTASCVSNNPCVVSKECHPSSGECVYEKKADGELCDPSSTNLCADIGQCQDGECIATMKSCVATDQCEENGYCDPTSGRCINQHRPDDTACNDNNACTNYDRCQNGVCTGTPSVTCQERICHVVRGCDPQSGNCQYDPLPDGSPCSDDDPCTSESCQGGHCVTSASGCDDNNPCTSDSCGEAGCNHENLPNGTECSYGFCGFGYCHEGECTFSSDTFDDYCQDNNPCTKNLCDPKRGCYYEAIADGESCGEQKTCKDGRCHDQDNQPHKGCQNGAPTLWPLFLLALFCWRRRRLLG